MDNPMVLVAAISVLGVVFSAILVRWTGREANTTGQSVAELAAITVRLQTELQTLDAGQKMWQAMFDSASERIDQQVAELAAVRADLGVARAEHAQCRTDLGLLQTEVRQLRGLVERRRQPRD